MNKANMITKGAIVAPFNYTSNEMRVLIGFNFKPMLSGESSSGEMQDGLNGLLGLALICDCR